MPGVFIALRVYLFGRIFMQSYSHIHTIYNKPRIQSQYGGHLI